MKDSAVFSVSNLIPLIGLYGFLRFWPNTVPASIAVYAPVFEIACLITMILIALMSLVHQTFRYKLFAYTTICYLLYLISVFLPTGGLKMNVGYALFAYIVISTVLSFVYNHIEDEQKRIRINDEKSILNRMPKASICLSLFILAGVGLPITPLFWNNFIIISEIFNYSLLMGVLTMISIFAVGLSMLRALYYMKENAEDTVITMPVNDISNTHFAIYMGCLLILFVSFIQPLWFVL
jgi:NADH:ubiquinone oxidoreductase subunit 4 (subunit M)